MSFNRPCIVCGRRAIPGASVCEDHRLGSARPRVCARCARQAQPGSQYCADHSDTDERMVSQPWRTEYAAADYRANRSRRYTMAGGRCELCGREVTAGEWQCDHLVPLSEGGTNGVTNLRVLCKPCHKLKTREDRRTRKRA